MRTVRLVTVDVREVTCAHGAEFFNIASADDEWQRVGVAGEPEVIQTAIPCRITHFRRRHGNETLDTYLAIDPRVKEELALFRGPDLVEGIKERWDAEVRTLKEYLRTNRNVRDNLRTQLKDLHEASVGQRIKWVFTGVPR
ncbi:MAG: hypothetical protein Tp125SUR00d2C35697761_48 [Prokaryotic dsDNA virus sp.]|nr:MAG: hypothetical protein Tp125SUR00d2C35697761_48 [Prokaryotic dsDNA virus sp.]|tara:strand:- start:17588 stop:18010 length:423 start_codon:yes stop_codon:yes gene_type:complete